MKLIVISILIVILLSGLYFTFFMYKPCSKKSNAIITFLGAPGSGKGTLAAQCAEQLNMQTLSTGDLCRQAIAKQDEQGKFIENLLKEGKLVPDEIISEMVKQWINSHTDSQKTIILDGYPRTAKQAELFTDLIAKDFQTLKLHVVSIELTNETIIKRISNRLVCENKSCQAVYNKSLLQEDADTCQKCSSKLIQRADDKEDVVRQRLEVFAKNNDPLVAFYHKIKAPFHIINAEDKSMKEVFESFKQLYQSIK